MSRCSYRGTTVTNSCVRPTTTVESCRAAQTWNEALDLGAYLLSDGASCAHPSWIERPAEQGVPSKQVRSLPASLIVGKMNVGHQLKEGLHVSVYGIASSIDCMDN